MCVCVRACVCVCSTCLCVCVGVGVSALELEDYEDLSTQSAMRQKDITLYGSLLSRSRLCVCM